MARRKSGRAHMAWVRSFRKRNPRVSRRRRARRNPWPIAGLVANPRRRHRRARRNPVMRRRRGYRRNPAFLGGLSLPPIHAVLYAGLGFVGAGAIETLARPYLPASITTSSVGKYAVRIGAVIALSFAAKAVLGREKAKMVAIGGGAYVLTKAAAEFLPAGSIPGLNAYSFPNAGMRAYVPQARRLAAPPWGATASVDSAPMGGANIVGGRFRRFQ